LADIWSNLAFSLFLCMMKDFQASPVVVTDEFWRFVETHQHEDVMKLRLKFHRNNEAWVENAINHIECLKKCGKKFGSLQPRLMQSPLSVEQATSERVALLHGEIAKRIVGDAKCILDMTCGMGIDLRAIATSLNCSAVGIEMNPTLASVTGYNFGDIEAVEILNCDSVGWLERYSGNKFDLVFIDPARRGDAGQRVFNIHHCQPDISELLPLLSLKARFAMVKLSPMLDVTQTLRDLPFTAELHVIDDGGECRELLAVLDFERDCHIEADIVVHSAHMELAFTYSDNQECECRFGMGLPGQWLFEPSPAAMKSKPFGVLCSRYGLVKFHPNTHLFVGDAPVEGLPGRWYEIEEVAEFSSSAIKSISKRGMSADVAVRNFPLKAEEFQKRLKIKPGGLRRIIGATISASDSTEKRMIFILKKPSHSN